MGKKTIKDKKRRIRGIDSTESKDTERIYETPENETKNSTDENSQRLTGNRNNSIQNDKPKEYYRSKQSAETAPVYNKETSPKKDRRKTRKGNSETISTHSSYSKAEYIETGGTSTETHSSKTEAEIVELQHEIMVSALCSAYYHSMRELFFVRAYRTAAAVQALAATAAFAMITATLPFSQASWLALFVAVAAIFTLVWDPAGMALRHYDLRRRFYEIYARAETAKNLQELISIRHEMRLIYSDEPPGYNVVKAIAWNATVDSIYENEEAKKHKIRITKMQRILANFWPYRGTNLEGT